MKPQQPDRRLAPVSMTTHGPLKWIVSNRANRTTGSICRHARYVCASVVSGIVKRPPEAEAVVACVLRTLKPQYFTDSVVDKGLCMLRYQSHVKALPGGGGATQKAKNSNSNQTPESGCENTMNMQKNDMCRMLFAPRNLS